MPPAEKHILEIVETGGVTAVLGRNGCGKSCLMKILSGSLKAGFCSMRIDGKWHRRFTEKEIRYLPQHPFIPGWLRLERALGDFGLQREDLERWFPEFISLRGTRIGELSGGEQRILECFIILRSPARFILLDEPFSQIAPLHVATLQTLIRQEKASKGILLTDHMYRHVTGIADRLYVMADGQAYPCENDEDLVRRSNRRIRPCAPIRGRGTARSGSATRPRTDPGRCFPDGSWRGSTCTPKWPRRHGSKPPKHPRRIGRNGRGPRPRNRPGSLRRHS